MGMNVIVDVGANKFLPLWKPSRRELVGKILRGPITATVLGCFGCGKSVFTKLVCDAVCRKSRDFSVCWLSASAFAGGAKADESVEGFFHAANCQLEHSGYQVESRGSQYRMFKAALRHEFGLHERKTVLVLDDFDRLLLTDAKDEAIGKLVDLCDNRSDLGLSIIVVSGLGLYAMDQARTIQPESSLVSRFPNNRYFMGLSKFDHDIVCRRSKVRQLSIWVRDELYRITGGNLEWLMILLAELKKGRSPESSDRDWLEDAVTRRDADLDESLKRYRKLEELAAKLTGGNPWQVALNPFGLGGDHKVNEAFNVLAAVVRRKYRSTIGTSCEGAWK